MLGPTSAIEVGPITDALAEDPVLGAGTVTDPSGCTQGLELSWDGASFPGDGAGRYHLYRSQLSHADALLQPALTPAGGILATAWSDAASPLDRLLYYVVQAEAVELPGCGDGPSVAGPTDVLDLAPLTDLGAEAPVLASASGADDDGCAEGTTLSWPPVTWPSPSEAGAYHVYRSTVSFADAVAGAPLTGAAGLTLTTWTDAAPPPNQALFYVVQAESFERPGCGDGPALGGLTDLVELGPLVDTVTGEVGVGGGGALDDNCSLGTISVSWDAAVFPGPGNGRYHVHRSELSLADALARPPLSPAGGVVGTAFLDDTPAAGIPYWYAVVAESTDFPGCGDGPSVGGPSAVIDCGSAVDEADLEPPSLVVGPLLRLSLGTLDAVTLDWTGAPMPPAGEDWAVLRTDGDASGGFVIEARRSVTTWTDAASAAPAGPTHVWFYDLRVADDCLLSED